MTETNRTELLKENLAKVVRTLPRSVTRSTVLTDETNQRQPLPVRKAQALALFLREVPIHIYPGELIVGMPFREEPVSEEGGRGSS